MAWSIISHHQKLLDQERGTIVKDWGGKIPVALAFANTYYAGMSNLGFHAVYGLFNAYDDVVCERFFLPEKKLMAEYGRTETPLLSLESNRPMTDFELVAFSLSYENDYPNVLKILSMARLAWRSADREEGDPFILAGGITVRLNPEPLADFMDLILLGDGELLVPDLLRVWREVRSEPLPKTERLLHLARSMTGAYAPAFYEAALDSQGRLKAFEPIYEGLPAKVTTSRVPQLKKPALTTQILTSQTEFTSTRLIEIGRGCGRGCRFCLAGFEYRPPRLLTAEDILDSLDTPLGPEPERVGLVGPAVGDHPEITEIVQALTDQGREVTVSSLRVDMLNAELVEALVRGGLKSIAIAPEVGSERMRAFINKGLSEAQILDGVQLLAEGGMKKVKLYFMIGLPTETVEDVRAITDLVKKIKDRLLRHTRNKKLLPELTLTISSFVPKASTPFQAAPMAEVKELKTKIKIIRNGLRGIRGLRIHFDVPKWAYLQAILSRGDRRISYLIEALVRREGNLNQARKEVSFNPDYFVTRSLAEDALFPWSFIDRGFFPDYFVQEMDRAQAGEYSAMCDPESCRRCGLCPPPA
ncbi:MAG: radical SAM protein [Deltaproteobacteria bacterium]|nr:radical SAM protein [Deltaproteobacteria bacterium]